MGFYVGGILPPAAISSGCGLFDFTIFFGKKLSDLKNCLLTNIAKSCNIVVLIKDVDREQVAYAKIHRESAALRADDGCAREYIP